jgi:GTP-binding protein
VTSAAAAEGLPADRLAEVALVGRSNVGKSSLINALVRRDLARTSAAPGKTRLANFYRVQRGSAVPFYLVDLPGYGYAKGGDASQAEFGALTDAYFARAGGGKALSLVLLVDARHPGLESDVEAWAWAASLGCPRAVVGTKVDKLSRAERERRARMFHSAFNVAVPLISARTGEGMDALWKTITSLSRRTVA